MKVGRVLAGGLGAFALAATGLLAVPAQAAEQNVTDLSDPAVLTAQALAESLVGDETEISNVKFTGSPLGAGLATGFADALGIAEGVVLASGEVAGENSTLIGPNTDTSNTGGLDVPGDKDLDLIVAPRTTNDATVLEFDFVPSSSLVTFSYVFGSEEYQEYVNSSYNDVFGFFVNGTNYATVDTPEGTQPITINSINHETNSNYYVDNSVEPYSANTELDGFTVVLNFEAPVNAGEVNTMKLAIADTADDALDSAVIIAAGSFQSNMPPTVTDLSETTPINTPIDISLQGSDPDGDELTFEIVQGPNPEHGTLSVVDGNVVTFTPAADYLGEATFAYLANDGTANSAEATVSITVVDEALPTPTPSTEPTDEPEPTTEPSSSPSAEPSSSPSVEPSSSPSPSVSATPTDSASPTPSSSDSKPSPSEDPADPDEDLADTGSNSALVLSAVGGVLLVAGTLIFMVKRRSTRH